VLREYPLPYWVYLIVINPIGAIFNEISLIMVQIGFKCTVVYIVSYWHYNSITLGWFLF
jgi:hypothetical protein